MFGELLRLELGNSPIGTNVGEVKTKIVKNVFLIALLPVFCLGRLLNKGFYDR